MTFCCNPVPDCGYFDVAGADRRLARRGIILERLAKADSAMVAVRAGAPGDVDAVMAIDEAVTGIAKPDYWLALFDENGGLRGDQRHFLVAETDSQGAGARVVGFIIGEARAWEFGSPPCGWVLALSIDPDARLGGVGTILLEAISERFRADGVHRMRTMIARNNHLLMSFFRSHGMMAGPYIQLEKELE